MNSFLPDRWSRMSAPIAILTLLLNNLIPLVGVLFWGWELYSVILIYWLENGVIGFYNVLKMAFAQGQVQRIPTEQEAKLIQWIGPQNMPVIRLLGRLFLIPFFIVHYGIFWFVHGIFIQVLFGIWLTAHSTIPGGFPSPFAGFPDELWGALGAMFISHGASFVRNYIGQGEYLVATPRALMNQPYGRVMVLHATIIGGSFLVTLLGQPLYSLLLLIGLKTAVDLWAHLHEHKRYQTAS